MYKSIQINSRLAMDAFEHEGEILYFKTENGVIMPPEVMNPIREGVVTDEMVQHWFSGNQIAEGFGADDEIRSVLIGLLSYDFLSKVLKFKTLERMSGNEMYEKFPAGKYVQQGDVLIFDEQASEVEDELDAEMRIRLNANIFYELVSAEIFGEECKFLRMGNASLHSHTAEEHLEGVPPEVNTIMEAIQFRNSDIKEKFGIDVMLPARLS